MYVFGFEEKVVNIVVDEFLKWFVSWSDDGDVGGYLFEYFEW